jgi:hypothetical protein
MAEETKGEGAGDVSGDTEVQVVQPEPKRPRLTLGAPVDLSAFATTASRIAAFKRQRLRKDAACWLKGKFSAYSGKGSAAFQHLVVCETCFEGGDESKCEINYGSSRSTGKVTSHLQKYHKDLWDGIQVDNHGLGTIGKFYKPAAVGVGEIARYIVSCYQPLSTVANAHFRDMIHAFKPNAILPDVKGLRVELER